MCTKQTSGDQTKKAVLVAYNTSEIPYAQALIGEYMFDANVVFLSFRCSAFRYSCLSVGAFCYLR